MSDSASIELRASWFRWLEATVDVAGPSLEGPLRVVVSDLGRPDAEPPTRFRYDGRCAPQLFAGLEDVLVDLHEAPHDVLSALLTVAWDLIVADRLDEGCVLPSERMAIPTPVAAGALARRGHLALARMLGPDDPAWAEFAARADRRAEALAALAEGRAPADVDDWYAATVGRWSTASALGAAAASLAGRADLAHTVAAALDAVHVAEDVGSTVQRLRGDGQHGNLSSLTRMCAAEAGLDVDGVPIEATLGVVAMSATLRRALARARERLAEIRPMLAPLPRTCARLDRAASTLTELERLLGEGIELGGARVHGIRRTPDLAAALHRADLALAADPLAREAWDIYRCGLFGQPVATASRFPRALLAGFAAARGCPDPALARSLILDWRACAYSYFDEPCPLPPDIDSFGTLARLYPQVAGDPDCERVFEEPLAGLAANLAQDGTVPVFLVRGFTDATAFRAQNGALLGTDCLVCQLHLLEGLVELPHARARALVPRVAVGALVRIERSSLGEGLYYRTAWATMVLARLAARLETHDEPVLVHAGRCFGEVVARLLPRLLRAGPTLAIDLACLRVAAGPGPFADVLAQRLLAMQRPDGLWDSDPVFMIPHRGAATWLRSRLLTTATVAHALDERRV